MPRIAAVGSSDAAVANNVEVNSREGAGGEGGGNGGNGLGGQVPFHKPGTRSARGALGGRGGRGGGGRGGRGGSSSRGGGKRQDPLKGGFKFGAGKK